MVTSQNTIPHVESVTGIMLILAQQKIATVTSKNYISFCFAKKFVKHFFFCLNSFMKLGPDLVWH